MSFVLSVTVHVDALCSVGIHVVLFEVESFHACVSRSILFLKISLQLFLLQ